MITIKLDQTLDFTCIQTGLPCGFPCNGEENCKKYTKLYKRKSMNSITLNEGRLQATDGKTFIDFRPEDYRVSGNAVEIRIASFDFVGIYITKNEIHPCPDGFSVQIGNIPIPCPDNKPGCLVAHFKRYAKLVPIKEQKSIENCPTLFPCDCENECAVLASERIITSNNTGVSAPQELQNDELRNEFQEFINKMEDSKALKFSQLSGNGIISRLFTYGIKFCQNKLSEKQEEIKRLKESLDLKTKEVEYLKQSNKYDF